MNILDTANKIVNERNEEKERQYGPFEEGMEKAAKIASLISGKDITADDVYIIMMSLKLSRQSYNHKEDNLLDLVAYVGSWNNYKNKQ
jgi:DNA-binding protein H-NS